MQEDAMRRAWWLLVLVMALPAAALAKGGPMDGPRAGGPGFREGGFGMGPGGPMGAWWNSDEVRQKLGLTEDQVKKLQESFRDHRGKLVDLRADLEKREMELQDLMEADAPDLAKIQLLTDQLIAARGRLQKEFMSMLLKVRTVVTKEQWHALRELRREHRGHGPDMPGPGAEPPPPDAE
jgi:Spy/CpxP family protein refolding chaperone